MARAISGGQAIIESVVLHGVDTVFGLPGQRVTMHSFTKRAARIERPEDAPVVIEVPVEPDSEVSPWRYIHPSPSPMTPRSR